MKVTTSIWSIISFRIISKHFKIYITINDVIGEKRIDLSYPIKGREIAVVSMHSNNVQYWLQGTIEVLSKTGEKIVLNKEVYMNKELAAIYGQELKLRIGDRDDVLRTSKLVNSCCLWHGSRVVIMKIEKSQ